jgi:hypothetical protein
VKSVSDPPRGIGVAARQAGVGERWLRAAADSGAVPHEKDVNGNRLFRDQGVEVARRLYCERLARRGRHGGR